jgi:hypothetical protein
MGVHPWAGHDTGIPSPTENLYPVTLTLHHTGKKYEQHPKAANAEL